MTYRRTSTSIALPFQRRHLTNSISTRTKLSMGWADQWDEIHNGGNPRWKITNSESHQTALAHFQTHVTGEPSNISILCPLAGDDPFVHLLWKSGYSVTTIDLVPSAVEALKEQFKTEEEDDDADCWSMEETDGTVIWKHASNRATLMVGDALQKRTELDGTFDAVYDKDSFGALASTMRSAFCTRISEYTKKDAILYLECKLKPNHADVKDVGPPYSLTEEELMEDSSYGGGWDYVEGLGEVYSLGFGGMQQTGHIMKRK